MRSQDRRASLDRFDGGVNHTSLRQSSVQENALDIRVEALSCSNVSRLP